MDTNEIPVELKEDPGCNEGSKLLNYSTTMKIDNVLTNDAIDHLTKFEIKKLTENDLKNRKKPCFDDTKIIDYVLVYQEDDNKNNLHNPNNTKIKFKRDNYLKNLQLAGLELRTHAPRDYIDKRINNDGGGGDVENNIINFNKNDEEKKQKLVYVLVHTPLEKLYEAAEKTRFKVPIQVNNLEKTSFLTSILQKNVPNPFKLNGRSVFTSDRNYFTAPYDAKIKQKFLDFWEYEGLGNLADFISSKDRSLLTYEFLTRTPYYSKFLTKQESSASSDPTKDINNTNTEDNNERIHYSGNLQLNLCRKFGIERLIEIGVFVAAYPLHEYFDKKEVYCENLETFENRQFLWEKWAKPKNFLQYQPMYNIRQYFGEKVAFYFSWLGFYTTWLFVPSIIGLFVFFYGLITLKYDIPTNEICNKKLMGNTTMCPLCTRDACDYWKLSDSCLYSKITHVFDNGGTVFFSIVMALWTVLFIEFWKRQQNTYRFEWDTIDYENKYDVIRPEYEKEIPKLKKHPITGEPTIKLTKRFINYLMSWTVVFFAILLVVVILLGIIFYRFSIYIVLRKDHNWRPYSSYISSATAASINLMFILALNRIYTWCAIKLTDIELHRTDAEYENAFTIKIYLFQFFNYYSSIFYIAFIKGSNIIEPCDPSGCLVELCIQLAIIMVGKQIINNLQEYLYPYIMSLINRKCWFRKSIEKGGQMQWQKDFVLVSWNKMTLFDEYLEMVIQYGFITLFVVAFPIAPFFAFLNNILEIRIDAHKFLVQMRRPLAKRARDIGIWLDILNSVSKIGVITNGLIIAFTSEFIPRLVYLISQHKEDLSGFVNYTLSFKNVTDERNGSVEFCRYRDFRELTDSENEGAYTIEFYHVNVARLAFIVVFEHVIFFAVTCLHWIIQDVPTVIKHQIERENTIIQNAIWNKPERNLAQNTIIQTVTKHRDVNKND